MAKLAEYLAKGMLLPPKTNITFKLLILELSTDKRVNCFIVTVCIIDYSITRYDTPTS